MRAYSFVRWWFVKIPAHISRWQASHMEDALANNNRYTGFDVQDGEHRACFINIFLMEVENGKRKEPIKCTLGGTG